VLLLLVATPAVADPPREGGFVLANADAAYASFLRDDISGDCEVFVGYVWAGTLKYFGGDVIRPHSDLEVRFEDCGPWTGFGGVVSTVAEPAASITELESADIDGIEVPLNDYLGTPTTEIATAYVDLTWTATGPVVVERYADETGRALHRSRSAEVDGGVMIEIAGGGALWFGSDHLVVAEAPEIWPKITHYNEVVFGSTP
jgi:hypothetical protein